MVTGYKVRYLLGVKLSKEEYSKGKKDGLSENFFENGLLRSRENFKDGKKDGTWTSWWDSKKELKEMQGSYRQGKMVDKWFFYDPNGNLKEIRYFSPTF